MFTIQDLSFRFQKENSCFFKGISISFESGKIHFIQGSNGSGKSTLFRILRGDIREKERFSGQLCIDGKSFNHNSVALVHQQFESMIVNQFSFFKNLQLANVGCYPRLSILPDHKDLPDFMQMLNIDYHKPVRFLSGGQRQILAILMTLQKTVRLLLLDEPTSALDVKNSKIVMDFLTNLVNSTNLIVLFICHDRALVEKYSPNDYFNIEQDSITDIRKIERVKKKEPLYRDE